MHIEIPEFEGDVDIKSAYVKGRSQSFSVGELYKTAAAGIYIDTARVWEIGEIALGKAAARQSADQTTICDLSGTGAQDTSIADLALKLAVDKGLGITIQI